MKVSGHCMLATDRWPNGDARVVKFLGVHMVKERSGRQPRNDVRLVDDTPGGQAEAVEDVNEITIPDARRSKRIKRRISDLVDKRVLRNIVGGKWSSKAVAGHFDCGLWHSRARRLCCVTPEMFGDLR